MTDAAEVGRLLADARRLRCHAGISARTVCTALGLHPSELSKWENQRRGLRLTPRTLRYVRVLQGLRRAEINQAAAQALLADNEPYGLAAEVREQPPEGASQVGAGGGVGGGLLLRDPVHRAGRPVDPTRL